MVILRLGMGMVHCVHYYFIFFFTLLKWLLFFLCFYFKFLVFSFFFSKMIYRNQCLFAAFFRHQTMWRIQNVYNFRCCQAHFDHWMHSKLMTFSFLHLYLVGKDFTKKCWNDAAFFALFLTNVYLWLATNSILSLSFTLIFSLFSIYFLF